MSQKINHLLNLGIERNREIELLSATNITHEDLEFIKSIKIGHRVSWNTTEPTFVIRPEKDWAIFRKGNTLHFIYLDYGTIMMGTSIVTNMKELVVL